MLSAYYVSSTALSTTDKESAQKGTFSYGIDGRVWWSLVYTDRETAKVQDLLRCFNSLDGNILEF